MRKLIRVLIIVVAALALVVFAVRLLVPAEKLKQVAFDQLHARTGLRASATSASVSFPWPIGIKLRQLQVEGPEGQPRAARVKGSADEVLVTADLASVLRRKPQIQEVRLKRPDFEVWVPEPAPLDSSAQQAPAAGLPPGAAGAIGLLSVEEGRLVVHGPGARELTVERFAQRARLHLQESGVLTGTVQTDLGKLTSIDPARPQPFAVENVSAELRLDGNVQARKGTVTVAKLSALGATVQGPVVLDFGADRRAIDAKLAVELDLAALMTALGPQLPPPPPGSELPQVRAGRATGELRVAGQLPSGPVTPDAFLALLAGEGEVSGLRLAALGRDDLVDGSMRWALAEGDVRLEALEARLPGIAATGQLSLPATGKGNLRGKLALNVDAAAALSLAKELWPRLPEQARAGKQDPSQWPTIAGALDCNLDLKLPLGRPLDPQLTPIAWDAVVHHLAILNPSLPDTLHVRGGKAVGTMLKADFYNIALDGPGMKGTLNGGATGWPARIEVTATGEFASLDLDAMVPAAASAAGDARKAWLPDLLPRAAHAAAEPARSGELPKPPANLAAHFVVRAQQLHTRGYRVQELLGRGVLEHQVLQLHTLQAKMGTGTILGTGGVDWTAPTPTWSIDANATDIPAAEVFSPVAGALAKALQTTLSGAVKLSGPIATDPVAIQSKLTGDCSVESKDGQLQTQPLLGDQLASLLGSTEAKRFEVLAFKRLSTLLKLQDGKVLFDDLLLDGPTSVAASGAIGMVDRRVDYGLTVKLPAGVTPDLGAFTSFASLLRDKEGRITVALRVSGPAAQPKIELDLSQVKERAKQGTQQAVKDKLKQLLPNSGGAPGAAPGAVPADSLAGQKATDAVKDLLGGLKKRKGKTP